MVNGNLESCVVKEVLVMMTSWRPRRVVSLDVFKRLKRRWFSLESDEENKVH